MDGLENVGESAASQAELDTAKDEIRRVKDQNFDLMGQIETLNAVNAKLTAKNDKFLADKKAALEREKQMFAPENAEGEASVAARPKEEIEAEIAALAAEEEEAKKDMENNENAQNQLAAAQKEENEQLKEQVKALEQDLKKASRSSPMGVAVPTGGEASSAEIQKMIADY